MVTRPATSIASSYLAWDDAMLSSGIIHLAPGFRKAERAAPTFPRSDSGTSPETRATSASQSPFMNREEKASSPRDGSTQNALTVLACQETGHGSGIASRRSL